MRILLDTHTLIWFLEGDEKLSHKAKSLILNPNNLPFISAASIWEMAIKVSIGKLELSSDLVTVVSLIEDNGIEVLPINMNHAIAVAKLPFHHKDPFDRLIIAQAMQEFMPVVGRDENFSAYPVSVLW